MNTKNEPMQDSRHLVCNDLLASDAFPKMPLDAALQFADEKRTTGGVMTCCALETLAAEVRRLQSDKVRMDWLESRARVEYSVGYWRPEEGGTLRQRLDKIMPMYPSLANIPVSHVSAANNSKP